MEKLNVSLTGQLLIAMPGMQDPRFAKTLVYMCSHEAEGAMGLVINRVLDNLTFQDLLKQLDIDEPDADRSMDIHFGGPVESGRGFVLHTLDYVQDSTLVIDENHALTATVDVVRAIAGGRGPDQHILALGYAGWAPGQLDGEIKANGWLSVAPDSDLVFGSEQEGKWERAMAKLGVDVNLLYTEAGHA